MNFVSDQFFIMAAVGLNAARVGAIIAPENVETKVASMFVQKFQSNSAAIGTGAAFAPLAPHQRVQRTNTNGTGGHDAAIRVDLQRQQENSHRPAAIIERDQLPGSPAPQSALHQQLPRAPERTIVDNSNHIELPTEEQEGRERTRIEGTGRTHRP